MIKLKRILKERKSEKFKEVQHLSKLGVQGPIKHLHVISHLGEHKGIRKPTRLNHIGIGMKDKRLKSAQVKGATKK